ncbi:MAG: Unknown protein [uncultured Sulfurovum sp.]|uniref:Uncharacterized protein n=1 Tax=uncultured Sulfurovum sp. TaxID=269237 RepID=A0A6S6S8I8_9BACT|nr:MAG: Unknown protein [uncultured Sulfurovum sp.]
MPEIHDPYLNTIQRNLNEEKIKERKEKVQKSKTHKKSFLSQNIVISDYIHLPESLQKFFLLSIFIFVPYLFGVIIMSLLLGYKSFQEFTTFNFDLFMLSWTVGYETIALILLLIIIRSALVFKQK